MVTATKFEPRKNPVPAMLGALLPVKEIAESLGLRPSRVFERSGCHSSNRVAAFQAGEVIVLLRRRRMAFEVTSTVGARVQQNNQ
jgi:hypothetical protein